VLLTAEQDPPEQTKTMRRSKAGFAPAIVASLAVATIGWGGSMASAATFNLTEVAPGIHFHQGRQVGLDSPERDDIANIGFIIGERCVAVIDTGGSIATGRKLRNALRSVTRKPVCYVVNTHVHYDHLLGNHAFASDNAQIVGHRRLPAAVANNRTFFLASFANELGHHKQPALIHDPDVTVERTRILDLGNRKIRLDAHSTSHTDNDLTVFDLNTNTLWASDLLFTQRIPALNGSINGWIEETRKLAASRVDRMIPGHGAIPGDWHAAVRAQMRYLVSLRSEIRRIIRKGEFLEDALVSVSDGEKERWLLFDQNHRRNVSRAFAELEWE
jgi:quinoprotein relay system zinc metallohydrolase 2